MGEKCGINVEDEENFFLIPIKNITAVPCNFGIKNVLDTSYETYWSCAEQGSHITIEPDYTAEYLNGRGINQVHISFYNGFKRQYYFQILASMKDNNEDFINITGKLMNSGITDALEPFFLVKEIKPKFIRIVFDGFIGVFTIELVNAKMQPIGKSYTPNTL